MNEREFVERCAVAYCASPGHTLEEELWAELLVSSAQEVWKVIEARYPKKPTPEPSARLKADPATCPHPNTVLTMGRRPWCEDCQNFLLPDWSDD